MPEARIIGGCVGSVGTVPGGDWLRRSLSKTLVKSSLNDAALYMLSSSLEMGLKAIL